jgi:hypothetical protein
MNGATLCVQYGAVMKEYVELPHSLWKKKRALAELFDESIQYGTSLKAKATTRSGKATKTAKMRQRAVRKA